MAKQNSTKIYNGFHVLNRSTIDDRLVLSRDDLLKIKSGATDEAYNLDRYPDPYFAVVYDSEGVESPQFYILNKEAGYSSEGRYVTSEGSHIGYFERVDYEYIKKHPSINGVELVGNHDGEYYKLQTKLTEGKGIEIIDVIDSEGKKIQVKVDNETITFNSSGELILNCGNALGAVKDSAGNLAASVLFDNKTIKLNSANELELPIDKTTIIIDSEGKLQAVPEPLKDGIATHARYDGKNEVIDVVFDDVTIVLNSEGKLKVGHDKSLESTSEGLHVNIDNNTLYQGSEGEIKAKLKNAYESLSEVKGVRSDLQGYLFDTVYTNYDYKDLDRYQGGEFSIGRCSSARSGNFYGRNLDWTYDNKVEFVVRTPRFGHRFATLGMTSCTTFTPAMIRSGAYIEKLKIVPLMICDGINEKGVVANTNVVTTEGSSPEQSHGLVDDEITLVSSGLVRYMLDNFATAQEAAEFVRDHVSLIAPNMLVSQGFEQHFMVADANKTYVIEIKKVGSVVRNVIEEQSAMTNFYINGVTLNSDGKVYTPYDVSINASHKPTTVNGVNAHGEGLERFNIIKDGLASANTKAGMRALMTDLFYTKAYTLDNAGHPEQFWFTEYCDKASGLTVDNLPSTFASAIATDKAKFNNRSRDPEDANFGTWQTTHSTVFDIENKKMYVCIQEDAAHELEFNFDYYTKDQIDELVAIDDKTIKRGSDYKAYVPIDNKTIFVDTDGLIKANPESLIDGIATHAHYTSEGYEKVDALYDDTLEVDSENQLHVKAHVDGKTLLENSEAKWFVNLDNDTIYYSTSEKVIKAKQEALTAGEAINIKTDHTVNVIYDNKTIKLDSNKLYTNIDKKTLIIGSEGIAANIDKNTIILNSEGKLAAKQAKIDAKTVIYDSEGKIRTAIGGWKETTTNYVFANQSGSIATTNPTEIAWAGSVCPEAGESLSVEVKIGSLPVATEAFNLVDDDLWITGSDTSHTYLDKIRFKKDLSVIEYTFDSTMLAMGSFTVKSVGDVNIYHKVNGKYIPVDNNTIILGTDGNLKAIAKDLIAGQAISIASDSSINVRFDNDTIVLNSEGNLKAIEEYLRTEFSVTGSTYEEVRSAFLSGKIVEGTLLNKVYRVVGTDSENVFFETTYKVNDQLVSRNVRFHKVGGIIVEDEIPIQHELVAEDAIDISAIQSDGTQKINVKFDNDTIILNSEGKLEAVVPVQDVKVRNRHKTTYSSVLNSEGEALVDLSSYATTSEAANSISFTMDSEFKLTLSLYNVLGDLIDEDMVDLPLEEMIVDGRYVDTSEGGYILLTLKNGNVIRIPLDSLIDGLVNLRGAQTITGSKDFTGNLTRLGQEVLSVLNVDGVTIKWNDSEGVIEATGLEVKAGEAVEVISSGKTSEGTPIKLLNVLYDNKSVELDSENKLAVRYKDGLIVNSEGLIVDVDDKTLKIDSNKLKVNIDGTTLRYNTSEDYIEATGLDVKAGDALEISLDSESTLIKVVKRLDVLTDEKSIKVNSANKLEVIPDNKTIELDSEGLKVIHDNTIEVNSEGLHVNLDDKTIIFGSEGLRTRIGGWKEVTSNYPFAEYAGTVLTTTLVQAGNVPTEVPEAGEAVSCAITWDGTSRTESLGNWVDDGLWMTAENTANTYLTKIRLKKDLTQTEFTFNGSAPILASGSAVTVTATSNSNLYHKADGKYMPIDNSTIILDANGNMQAVAKDLVAGKAIILGTSEDINVVYDDRTIKLNNSENSLYIPIDNLTIQINSSGELVAMPEPLKNGIATEIKYDVRDEVVNVLFDGKTIFVNSENKLEVMRDEETIVLGSEGLYVPFDHKTIILGSEGLSLPIDNQTIILNSEGKLQATFQKSKGIKPIEVNSEGLITLLYDGETLVIDSEGNLLANIDNKTIILDSEGKLMAVPEPLKDGIATKIRYENRDEIVDVLYDSESIALDSEGKLKVLEIPVADIIALWNSLV